MLPTELYGDFHKSLLWKAIRYLGSIMSFMDWLVKMFSQMNVRKLKVVGFCLPYQDQP